MIVFLPKSRNERRTWLPADAAPAIQGQLNIIIFPPDSNLPTTCLQRQGADELS